MLCFRFCESKLADAQAALKTTTSQLAAAEKQLT